MDDGARKNILFRKSFTVNCPGVLVPGFFGAALGVPAARPKLFPAAGTSCLDGTLVLFALSHASPRVRILWMCA